MFCAACLAALLTLAVSVDCMRVNGGFEHPTEITQHRLYIQGKAIADAHVLVSEGTNKNPPRQIVPQVPAFPLVMMSTDVAPSLTGRGPAAQSSPLRSNRTTTSLQPEPVLTHSGVNRGLERPSDVTQHRLYIKGKAVADAHVLVSEGTNKNPPRQIVPQEPAFPLVMISTGVAPSLTGRGPVAQSNPFGSNAATTSLQPEPVLAHSGVNRGLERPSDVTQHRLYIKGKAVADAHVLVSEGTNKNPPRQILHA